MNGDVGVLSGFSTFAVDDYGREALSKAAELNPFAKWFLATDADGSSDMDIAYEIPQSVKSGKLGGAIRRISSDAQKVFILFYDLGTHEEDYFKGLNLSDVNQTLERWYAMGAPTKTVLHEFLRDEPCVKRKRSGHLGELAP